MYTKYDSDGNKHLLLVALVIHHRDNKAVFLTDQQITVWGRSVFYKATVGWQICCQWMDSSTSWEKLSKVKESHIV